MGAGYAWFPDYTFRTELEATGGTRSLHADA